MEKKQLEYMNGAFSSVKEQVINLKNDQDKQGVDISDIKKRLLDPEDGVIVRVNANSKYAHKLKELDTVNTVSRMNQLELRFSKLF